MPSIHFRSLPTGPYSVAVSQSKSTIEAQFGSLEKPPQPTKPTGQIGTATIEVNRRQGTAPAGFFFSIKTEGWSNGRDGFDPYYDLHYRWEFSDPGHYTRHDTDDLPWGRWYDVAGERVLINDGTVPKGDGDVTFLGNDKNIAYGPHVSHTFDPGHRGTFNKWTMQEISLGYRDCIVRCEIRMFPTDAEPLLVKEETIRVRHPDSEFPPAQTFLIANSATPVGDEPAHSGTIYTTLAAAASAGRAHKGDRVRYRMRRGQSFDAATNKDKFGNSSKKKLMIDTYGEPEDAAAVVNVQNDIDWTANPFPFRDTLEHSFDSSDTDRELILSGWDLAHPYDPSDPSGLTYQPPDGVDLRVSSSFKTVWDMKFSGLKVAIGVRGNGFKEIIIGNTYITNYCNYGVFINSQAERFGAAGLWVKQHPKAVKGPGFVGEYSRKSPPFYVGHTTIRVEQLDGPIAMNLVDFMSVGGNGSPHQPSLRMQRNGEPRPIPDYVVDRMRTEGGQPMVQTGYDASFDTNPQNPGRIIYDKIYTILQHAGLGAPIVMGAKGPCIRNCVIVYPSNSTWLTGSPDTTDPVNAEKRGNSSFLEVSYYTSDGVLYSDSNWKYEVRIYSNTFVNLRDVADQRSGDNLFPVPSSNPLSDHTYTENNIWAFPNGTPNTKHNASFDYLQGDGSNFIYAPDGESIAGDWLDLTALFEPGQKGFSFLEWYQDAEEETFRTVYGTDPEDAPILTPKAGTPLAGGADVTLHVAVDDFFGRVRGTNPSRGAMEPL